MYPHVSSSYGVFCNPACWAKDLVWVTGFLALRGGGSQKSSFWVELVAGFLQHVRPFAFEVMTWKSSCATVLVLQRL